MLFETQVCGGFVRWTEGVRNQKLEGHIASTNAKREGILEKRKVPFSSSRDLNTVRECWGPRGDPHLGENSQKGGVT